MAHLTFDMTRHGRIISDIARAVCIWDYIEMEMQAGGGQCNVKPSDGFPYVLFDKAQT